jgi:AcrR family transcriptional regulator
VGAKTPKTSDRRIERTRRLLREAMIGLILERGWDAVSVQEICARADVGRSTFYMHFADKEDLLVGGFDDLRRALRAGLASSRGEPLGFVPGLVEHARENERLFRAIVGRSGQVVQQRFHALVVELVREDLAGLTRPGPPRDAAIHFLAGAFLGLLAWWLEARRPLPPSELAESFLRMARPVIERLAA